jgi:hypothetical protein
MNVNRAQLIGAAMLLLLPAISRAQPVSAPPHASWVIINPPFAFNAELERTTINDLAPESSWKILGSVLFASEIACDGGLDQTRDFLRRSYLRAPDNRHREILNSEEAARCVRLDETTAERVANSTPN